MFTPFLTTRDSMSELRGLLRQMDEVFRGFDRPLLGNGNDPWMPAELRDEGETLALRVDMPGVAEKDVGIEVTQHGATIKGERKIEPPAGFEAHWRERRPYAFTRTFALPCRIDVEAVSATIKNGVLCLRMAKLPEERPKQVAVTT